MFEKFALNFSRERAPSHDDGRTQIFENFLFFGESPFEFQFIVGRGSTAFILPTRKRCGEMVASIGLLIFSGGHPLHVGWLTALYQ